MILLAVNWAGVRQSLIEFWGPTFIWLVVITSIIVGAKIIVKKMKDR